MFAVISVNCTLRNANFQKIGYLNMIFKKKSLSLIAQAVVSSNFHWWKNSSPEA